MRAPATVLALVAAACGSVRATDAPTASPPFADGGEGASDAVLFAAGGDVLPAVAERVAAHLRSVVGDRLRVLGPGDDEATRDAKPGALIIALGGAAAGRDVRPSDAEIAAMPPESLWMRTGERGGVRVLTASGGYGAYALLEELGFGFLHPLAPSHPKELVVPEALDRRESPRWPMRGVQLHTMHPLELTRLLNGWGQTGPDDAAGWEAMLPEWDRFLEWMLANRQNRVHWVLLEADSWSTFATSDVRLGRLKRLVDRGHAFGLTIGVDVPIALGQQHTFRLITQAGELADETAQLESRVDWLMRAGFDYLATENGTTEFTHADATRMVAWMDALAAHLGDVYRKRAFVKIHCSTGQTTPDYTDPWTHEPLNVNFLPHFADPRLGIMPHTVQHYGLDDPAPTYGNVDFSYMRNFLRNEIGRRPVLWHPEVAYWVSFDVDVPLFLPLYAERRVHDLRLLGADATATRMDGQQYFSSGWEWGYWLNEVVAARAAWDPHLEAPTDQEALARVLAPALRPFGGAAAEVVRLIVDTARAEKDLLIDGKVAGAPPASIARRNGQAYLQGFEAWDDISTLAASIPGIPAAQTTQPERLGLVEMRTPLHLPPRYTGEVEPLLAQMEADLGALDARWDALGPRVPEEARDVFDDLRDAMKMTALRARQMHGLYDYVDARDDANSAPRLQRLATARTALDEAARIVARREPRYRVPAQRIAGWGPNPTAYDFGYLWTVRSLYYFWRDEGKAVDAPRSPCYLNILNIADVATGEGPLEGGTQTLRALLDNPATGADVAECLGVPRSEPVFPMFGLRQRP
jgi:hypothetical protein